MADANVLVSAAPARSPDSFVLTIDAALDGEIELATSPLLLQEVAMVLARPRLKRYVSAEDALSFIAELAVQTALVVDPEGPHPQVCRDPKDDYLVALGRSSQADAIVTGDLDLFAVDQAELGIEVISPRQLVERLG